MMFNSINSCDIDLRKDLYRSIILPGGSTCLLVLCQELRKKLNIYILKEIWQPLKIKKLK